MTRNLFDSSGTTSIILNNIINIPLRSVESVTTTGTVFVVHLPVRLGPWLSGRHFAVIGLLEGHFVR